MQVQVQAVAPAEVEADTLAVPLTEEGLSETAKAIDEALDGLLQQLLDEGELRSDLGQAHVVHVRGRLPAKRIAVAGLGKRDLIDADALRTAGAAVAQESGQFTSSLAWALDSSLPLPVAEQASALVEGTLLGAYEPARWKHDDHKPKLTSLVLCGDTGVTEGVQRTTRIAEWVNRARDLVNSPPNEATPERLAARAAEIASDVEHVQADALGPEQITQQGMGAFAAVAQGSDVEPRLVVLRYEPPEPSNRDFVLGLVGKAITFDTGGISLKPSLHMQDMKGDMAGGAAVGEASGDHAWPWPMHPRYRRYVDSAFADIKNSSDLRQGSPVLAAEFLKEFAGEGPWAHADIAGPAFLERPRGDYLSQRGGTGYGVRLIVELASRLSA